MVHEAVALRGVTGLYVMGTMWACPVGVRWGKCCWGFSSAVGVGVGVGWWGWWGSSGSSTGGDAEVIVVRGVSFGREKGVVEVGALVSVE